MTPSGKKRRGRSELCPDTDVSIRSSGSVSADTNEKKTPAFVDELVADTHLPGVLATTG